MATEAGGMPREEGGDALRSSASEGYECVDVVALTRVDTFDAGW